ncbi:MAG: hypothetical protein ACOX87_12050 [Chloroflexota bacterium]|jgi:mono/diheme cytochrome c family protein
MRTRLWTLLALTLLFSSIMAASAFASPALQEITQDGAEEFAQQSVEEGRQIFRFDTFGSEAFWGDSLQLHKAIAGEAIGGVGPGVSPNTALSLGLKVDANALPTTLVEQIEAGNVNLDDPATTVELLRLNAVVGVRGFFTPEGGLQSVGITCAICHSVVDDSFAPGIGNRLDGWANRDLDIGQIIAIAPNLQPVADSLGVDVPTVRQVVTAWGPGKFDAELFLDGKGFRPDGKTAATLIPAAYGLAGSSLHTWTGWGNVTHWNAFVANLEMHGIGRFYDPRLNDPEKFPVAVRNGLFDVRGQPDLISDKLIPLHLYQLSIEAPEPPAGSFDPVAAQRGQELFNGKAGCANCHVPPLFFEPGWPIHSAEQMGVDDFQAMRGPTGGYKTMPLKGLWAHQKGGFYHDGRYPDLVEVVLHYNTLMNLNLNIQEVGDLAEYLKSL